MNFERFAKIKKLVILLVLAGVFLSLYFDLLIVSVMSVGIGMVLLSFFRTTVKDVIVDERIESLSNRAAMVSFRVILPILGLTSMALLISSGDKEFHYLQGLGVILAHITCLSLGVYVATYLYFRKKFGG